MDNTELDQLFPRYHNVANGVRKMIQLWEIGPHTVKPGKCNLSLQFIYAKGHHAFRVRTATGDRAPEVVIYSGRHDSKRGSPLLKRANEKDIQKLKDLCFKVDRPGWRKLLSENTEPDFYTNFVEHALKMVR